MTKQEWKENIEETIEEALYAFWKVVASRYPSATGGEFGIAETIEMNQKAEDFIVHWLELNHPTYGEEICE